MSHYPASGIAPHQLPVGRPRKVLLMCCCTSNLRGRQGGQPACRSHSASWSMSPSHTALNSKHWLPDQLRGLVLFSRRATPFSHWVVFVKLSINATECKGQ